MNLSQLVFDVKTDKLKEAVDRVKELGAAVSNLNKATADETKAAIDNEKVKQQQAKTSEANAKAAKAEADAIIAKEKAEKLSSETTKSSTSILEKHKSIVEFMVQGYSSGQSSILAMAKASGAARDELDELGKTLQLERRLTGASPFDKSMSGLVALKNQYGEVREVIRQFNADSGLTAAQSKELARDKERIIERMKAEGKGFQEIRQAVREHNQAFVEAAGKVNALSRIEKDRERSIRDVANATRNVESAEERLFATVAHLNGQMSANSSLNERAALALGSYERNLRLAGITGEEAAKRLQKFKAAQEQVSAMEAKRRGDFVARGIGVQMGDVAVSLASGMNPLTVAIQQSDQIRGLIQQSGLEAAQMAGIMKQAFGGIVDSFKQVGVAMGSFVVGGIKSVGDGVYNLINSFGTIDKMAVSVANTLVRLGADPLDVIDALEASTGKLKIAFSVLGTVAAVTATAIAVNFYQTIKANDALRLSVITSGAALGATSDEMIKLAENTRKAGSSSNELKSFFSVLATEGFKFKGQLEAISLSSQQFSSVTGESLAEIAKEYAAMQKDPVKALTELAIKTGEVDAATVELVRKLSDAGMQMDAARIATEALSSAHTKMAEKAKQELSAWSLLWIDVKGHISDVGTALTSLANNGSMQKIVAGLGLSINGLAALNTIKSDIGTLTSLTASGDERQAAFERLQKLQENFNKDNQQYADILNGVVKPAIDNATSATSNSVYQSEKYRAAIKSELGGLKEKVKELSKEEYIQRRIQELRRKTETPILAVEDFIGIRKKAAEEWESSNKKSSTEKKADREAERLKELASFYNQMSDAGFEAYNKDYSKRIEDINKLQKAGMISDKAFGLGRTSIEQDQPWYKQWQQQEEAVKRNTIATDDFNRSLEQQQTLQLMGIDAKTKDIGLTEEDRLVKEQLAKVEENRVRNLERINDLVANSKLQGKDLETYRESLVSAEQRAYEETKRIVEERTKLSYDETHSFSAGWKNAFASYTDAARNAAEMGKRTFEAMTDGMTDAIMKFVTTGKMGIKDFANTFLQEILRMQIKQASAQLIGASGIGGFISSILPFGSSTSASTGPSTAAGGGSWLGSTSGIKLNANANGNAFMSSGIVNKYANGGAFTNSIVSQPTPFMFANGARFGVMGEAGPEAILPLQRNSSGQLGVVSSGASTNVSVDIHNYTGANVKTEEVSDSRGGRKINVIIGELAAGEVNRPGSALNKSMRNGFGLSPALNGR